MRRVSPGGGIDIQAPGFWGLVSDLLRLAACVTPHATQGRDLELAAGAYLSLLAFIDTYCIAGALFTGIC